jgi:Sulfite oxidase and related enzymes
MVLECSGNRREYFEPKVYGEQWKDGAISQGVWKGVPLKRLLEMVGVGKSAKEVVFIGHDKGPRTDMEGIFNFARSLPIEEALQQDILIACELNGCPIPYEQGYPLRLIVPQWYAMASVKWLKEIRVIDHKFQGPFQTVDYVYYPHKEDDAGARPVTNIKIDSIIQKPLDYSILDTGCHEIYGIAWSGKGSISKVELSFDNGVTWAEAELQRKDGEKYAWTPWRYLWDAAEKGEYNILCRAYDCNGNIQPFEAEWNRKGYGYNAVYNVHVKIE